MDVAVHIECWRLHVEETLLSITDLNSTSTSNPGPRGPNLNPGPRSPNLNRDADPNLNHSPFPNHSPFLNPTSSLNPNLNPYPNLN